MKPTVKIVSLLLAVLMLFTAIASGCSLKQEWSYKTSDKELAIGVYIYALYNAYNRAQSFAEELDGYDSTKDTWLDMEITDDDDNKAVARQWIKDQAELLCLQILAVDAELKKMNATADEATVANLEANAESNWNFGTTYTQYIGYVTPLKTTLEPYGISFDSFKEVTVNFAANEEKLFDMLYSKGGTQEVTDDQLNKYFDENYVRYCYLPVALSETTTDEETQESKTAALSDDKIKEITDTLDGYAKQVNAISDTAKAAETSDKLISEYMTSKSMDESSLVKNTMHREDINIGEELDKAVKELGEGKATTVKVGEGDSATYYYVFRYNSDAARADYLAGDTNKQNVIVKMKEKDFNNYVKDLAGKLEHDKNGAVDGYDPKMFFVAKEPETTAAAKEE